APETSAAARSSASAIEHPKQENATAKTNGCPGPEDRMTTPRLFAEELAIGPVSRSASGRWAVLWAGHERAHFRRCPLRHRRAPFRRRANGPRHRAASDPRAVFAEGRRALR